MPTPAEMTKRALLKEANAEDEMRRVPDSSADLVIADPPYNIGVGGAKWDKVNNYMEFARKWLRESVRALRPGGALLLYGSPCRSWIARMTLMLVDELGMKFVMEMPWCYTQGAQPRSLKLSLATT